LNGWFATVHRGHDFLVGRVDDYKKEADKNHGVRKIGDEEPMLGKDGYPEIQKISRMVEQSDFPLITNATCEYQSHADELWNQP